jgi:hypothetical protein
MRHCLACYEVAYWDVLVCGVRRKEVGIFTYRIQVIVVMLQQRVGVVVQIHTGKSDNGRKGGTARGK